MAFMCIDRVVFNRPTCTMLTPTGRTRPVDTGRMM